MRCDVGRERTFRQSLSKLKEEVVRANAMVREANFLAHEMSKKTEFSVTLQIPAANRTPNRKVGHPPPITSRPTERSVITSSRISSVILLHIFVCDIYTCNKSLMCNVMTSCRSARRVRERAGDPGEAQAPRVAGLGHGEV